MWRFKFKLRIQAIKALQVVPEIKDKILNNEMSLNSLARTQNFINQMNKQAKAKAKAINRESETAAEKGEQPLPPPQKIKKKYNFEAEAELVAYIDELKSLLSHQVPSGDLADLLKQALPLAIQNLKIKRGLKKRSDFSKEKPAGNNAQAANTTSVVKFTKRSRHIPNEIIRQVWQRDQGCCQHKDIESGTICRSRYQLQTDHLQPWSYGGEHLLENIQLRCSVRNRYRWENRHIPINYSKRAENFWQFLSLCKNHYSCEKPLN